MDAAHYEARGLLEPLPRRERQNRVLVADLDDEPVVLAFLKLAADVAVAQLAQFELVELVDETSGDLRRRVFGRPHAVLPQLREHVVSIAVRRAVSLQPLPSPRRAWPRGA